MNAASAEVPRSRFAAVLLAIAAAGAVGSLAGPVLSGEPAACAALGVLGAAVAIALVSLRRLDLLLLLVNVAALALLPAVEHRTPLEPREPRPFYDWTFARATAPELLALAALAAQWLRRQAAPGEAPARAGAAPLLALSLLGLGLLVGLLRGNDLEACLRDGRKIAYVALAHELVVRVADDPARRRWLGRVLLAALSARALATLVGFVADRGFHYRGFLRASVDVGDFLGFLALVLLPAARLRAGIGSRRERALPWLLVALGAAATLATFSRSAWCAAPFGLAVVLLHGLRAPKAAPRPLLAVGLLLALSAPLVFGGLAEKALARLAPLSQPTADASVSYRLRELRGAAAAAAEHPLAGLGLGTGFDAGVALIDRRRGAPTLVHNLYLWSALKAGLAGLLLVLAMLAVPALALSRAARRGRDPGAAAQALGLLALLLSFAVLGMVGAMLNQARVAFALGLMTGFAQCLAEQDPTAPQPAPGVGAQPGGRGLRGPEAGR
jgi:hypothetical protein